MGISNIRSTLATSVDPLASSLYARWRRIRDELVPPGSSRRDLYDRMSWAIVSRVYPRAKDARHDDRAAHYEAWCRRNTVDDAALRQVDTSAWPTMSVLIIGRAHARRSMDSVEAQVYSRRTYHVATTLRRALEMANGDYVVLLEAGDQLAPDALFRYAEAASRGAVAMYADEDRLDLSERRHDEYFKPGWSPELLTSTNYVGSAMALRRDLAVSLDAEDAYDLTLRLAERNVAVEHLSRVLYHVGSDRTDDESGTLAHAMRRRKLDAEITCVAPGRYRTRYAIDGEPRVAIIIPTRDRLDLLRVTIDSIVQRSTWKHYEILVVDNGSTDPATLAYLAELPAPHRVLRDPRPFNWSALNNAAARATDAPLLLFLNNDVEVLTPDWLEALIEHAQRPEVGAVGAKLLYPDGKIQHAGVLLGVGGLASHSFRTRFDDGSEYHGLASVVRDCSAVTGACLMVRRDAYDLIGGFDEALAVAYNDVDFCLRLGTLGLRNVYTPWARLFHFESATRGPGHPPENEKLFVDRWRELLAADPFYNPNLSTKTELFDIRVAR